MKCKLENLTRQQIHKIAVSYSSTPDEISAAYYCEHYGISESVFYHCLEKAVEESMVTLDTANKIAAKAARNGERHAGSGAKTNTLRHYQRLIDSREEFRFNVRQQKRYAEMYANSPLDFKAFCLEQHIRENVMSIALHEAIEFLRISDSCVEKLYEKSKRFHGEDSANRFFNKLKATRKANFEAKKQHERELRKARYERRKSGDT